MFRKYITILYVAALLLLLFSESRAATEDSLKVVFNTTSKDEDRISSGNKLIEHFLSLGKTDSLLKYFERTKEIAKKMEKPTEIGHFYREVGVIYAKYTEETMALEAFYKALEIGKQINDVFLQTIPLLDASIVYTSLGNFEKAYEYQLTVLNILEQQEEKDLPIIAETHYYIGGNFFYQFNYRQALEHYEKSLSIQKDLNNKEGIYSCYGAIGSVYGELNDLDNATKYIRKSLEMAEEVGDELGVAYAMHNMGQNYFVLKEYDKAKSYFLKSKEIMEKFNHDPGLIFARLSLAGIYIETGNKEKAIEIVEETGKMVEDLQDMTMKISMYGEATEIYEKAGNYPMAFEYQKKYSVLRDSLVNEESVKSMGNLKKTFEVEKAEYDKKIALLKKDKKIQQLYGMTGIIAGLFLLSLVLIFYWNFRKQKNLNEILAQKNEEIRLQNYAIQNQHLKLEASYRDLKKFSFIASHDLKEPLRTIGSYTTLLERKIKTQEDETVNEYMSYIKDSVNRMYQLLRDITTYSNVNEKLPEKIDTDMNKIVSRTLDKLSSDIISTGAQVKVGNLPNVQADKEQVVRLMENIIQNAIKFNQTEKPFVEIKGEKNGLECVYSIKDNGIGIEKEYKNQIFDMFKRLNYREHYEGNGIGLAICNKIIEHHGGRIWVESEGINKGSTFYFSLPFLANEMT